MYMYLFLAQVVATALSARVPTHPLVSRVLHHSRMPSTHSHAKESQKRGTVVVHAVRPQRGNATEHAERRTPGGRAVLKPKPASTATEHVERRAPSGRDILQPNAECQQAMQAAQEDRADNSMENLVFRLGEFLTAVLSEALNVPGFRHATEQAASSTAEDPGNLISHDDCVDIVFEHIATWAQRHQNSHAYSFPELLLHKRMWDVMTRDKAGLPKEQSFTYWCRRVAACKTSSTATGHAQADSTATNLADSTSTENAEGSASFRALAEDILTNDLTESQMQQSKYKLREGKTLTRKQRNTINNILRQNLGDARVAIFLFNHPIPRLLDLPMRTNAPTKALLQNMLEEFMTWHASLLQSLLEHQQHPDVIMARRLSDLDQMRNELWRLCKMKAKQRMNYGASLVEQRDSRKRKFDDASLAEQRDSRKRTFDDMSATEQQILEDFDTQKARRPERRTRLHR